MSHRTVRMHTLPLLLALASCTTIAPPPECDHVEGVVIQLPEVCYEDLAACPQVRFGEPWEGTCSRSYMCEMEQPDGSFPYVCTTAYDCDCMEDYADCDDRAEPPGFCALQQ